MPVPFTVPTFITAMGVGVAVAFRLLLVSMIGKIFLTLGVGLYTYNYALPSFYSFIQAKFSALPPFVYQSVQYVALDVIVTACLSAAAVRALGDVVLARRPV